MTKLFLGASFLALSLGTLLSGCVNEGDEADGGNADGAKQDYGSEDVSIGSGVRLANPKANYLGLSLGEWAAAWWTWKLEQPFVGHPENGGDCAAGNAGPVWFLTGHMGDEPVVRDCKVPLGTTLGFVMGATECSSIEGDHAMDDVAFGTSGNELRKCAIACEANSPEVELAIDVDGHRVPNNEDYYVFSPVFSLTLPEDNYPKHAWELTEATGGVYQSVHYGHTYLVKPLEAGSHTIRMKVVYGDGFKQDVTYNITTE